MKIINIQLKFIPHSRPKVLVTFDKLPSEADCLYIAAKDKEHDMWVYRGQDGDYVHCGVEVRPAGAMMKQDRVRMEDGMHPIWPLHSTNSVAVNSLMRMCSPVMDVGIDTGNDTFAWGHVDAVAVAKYLYATHDGSNEGVALAVLEWPSGIRVYEPVIITRTDEGAMWDAKPNRECDTFQFLCTPDDKLTPLTQAIGRMT